jgi:hypothetical protein
MEIVMRHVLCSARVLRACTAGLLAWGLAGATRAEFVRGEINGWTGNDPMAQDASFGNVWKATLTATNTDAASDFKFEQNGLVDWATEWAAGSSATKNATVGSLASPGGALTFDQVDTRRYSFNMDAGHASYVVMETTGTPVSIASVTDNSATRWTNTVTATIQLSASPGTEESVWVRFTTNGSFSPSHLIPASGSGTNYSATLPATPNGRTYYYVLTSTMPSNIVVSSGFDLATLRGKNAGGSANFSYLLDLGNSWHIPTNAEPSGARMRNPPTNGVLPSTTVYVYNGTYSVDSDQTGGALLYRLKGASGWSTNNLAYDTQNGANKYWSTAITGNTFAATNEVEYYLKATYGTNATTFLGTTNNTGSVKYGYEADAQANPFSFVYGGVVTNYGNSWHFPTNTEPSGAFMRNPPTNGVSPSTAVHIYNGTYTNDSDQTGGALFHRLSGGGSWTETALAFDSNNGFGNQYWKAVLTGNTYGVSNTVEYFLKITYNNRDTTFLGTTNNADAAVNVKYDTTNAAAAHPFSFQYGSLVFNLGNAYHVPGSTEPPGATMRNPINPIYAQDTYLYNGNQFQGGGNAANQTGGTLYFRKVGAGSWSSGALSFDTTHLNNKYWVAAITGNTYAAGDTIEYYFGVTYSDRDTTYVGTTNGGVSQATFGLASLAETNAFSFTYQANLGNAWHIPVNSEPPGTTMRNPLSPDPATNQAVYVYNGNQFQGDGNAADQTGGKLVYRKVGTTAWQTNAMVFNAESGEVGNNKYWRGEIAGGQFAFTNQVEYYLAITYGTRDTTYLGTTNGVYSTAYASESQAQAAPFTYTYDALQGLAAAYLWHNNNRVIYDGTNVQFWVKIGYAEGTGSNRYVDHAALYYTTDGNPPGGAKGQPTNGSTSVTMLQFDHMEEDSYEGGDAMWWVGSLTNLPYFTTVRYQIGAYKSTNEVERFADYGTSGTNHAEFTFALGTLGTQVLAVNGLNADYTATKFFVDEIAGETQTVVVTYTPGAVNVTNVEVFSNLDRRDYADVDYTNALIAGDGYPDGIKPPDGNLLTVADAGAYFRPWTMTAVGGGQYAWTGRVSRTGAYRLTARFQTNGSPAWTWYSGGGRRDHAIVVSPKKALDMTLYELNTLTVEATAASEAGRSTFRDLLSTNDVAGDDDSFDPFNLEYLDFLQANCLWFQPIHPSGVNRAENDPNTGSAYQPGSPYATKDYWAVTPKMGAPNTEAGALQEFSNFVAQCDSHAGGVGTVNIMLDGVFNHTSWDAVMGQGGVDLGFTGSAATPIGQVRPQWYALISDYGEQATYYNSAYVNDFATAPDRGDFGKWNDVTELYFGKYSALVRHNPENNGDYLNEDDVYDFAGANTNQMDLWKYFAYYPEYWLRKTGHGGTNTWNAALDDKGIDALRCDFGQGLPPQLWEYIINRTRAKKWNFVFMAETLDGGKPGYRSNRHFDLLNENLVFQFTQSKINDSSSLSYAFYLRGLSYNGGAVLLNVTSHDEVMPDNDPWITASRYAAISSMAGLPMIFYGQEKGIGLFNAGDPNAALDGFADHELNFGKYVPHFKRWNQLQTWTNSPPFSGGLDQLYGRINWARLNSPALRSRNYRTLGTTGGPEDSGIFAVAKWEQSGAGPATSDVVLAFTRFMEHGGGHSLDANTFSLQPVWNDLGLDTNKSYTVRNLASSDAFFEFTNGWPQTGAQLWNNGIYVELPVDVGGAITRDGAIVQYLKIVEVTNVVNQAPVIVLPGSHILALGSSTSFPVTVTDADGDPVTTNLLSGPAGSTFTGGLFSWTALPTNFVNSTNLVVFTADDQQGATNSVATNSATIVVPFDFDGDGLGDAWEIGHYGTLSNGPAGDTDSDGFNNNAEYVAGTQPTNLNSLFRVQAVSPSANPTTRVVTVGTEPGRRYRIFFTDAGYSNTSAWSAFANTNNGVGTWLETNTAASTRQFADDQSTNTTLGAPAQGQRSYRVTVESP